MTVTLLIPTLNEAVGMRSVMPKVKREWVDQILIVDGKSKDGTADIAREMGWSDEQCKNLQLIGLVHDIGKISIPSEILSKPRKLTSLEYEMVKTHAESGYEILKDIEFPLPIAKIIRQHHERMDGSGYPQGLKDQQILPEARVLAVADVLESMASHRPYRPALGIEVAIKEIDDHKGILFDQQVVDTVLKMIREKGYQLPV